MDRLLGGHSGQQRRARACPRFHRGAYRARHARALDRRRLAADREVTRSPHECSEMRDVDPGCRLALRAAHPGYEPFFYERFFARISFRRCGVIGSRVMAPGMPMASSMAAAMVAPTGLMPPSPAPLTPRGLSGLGASSVISTSSGGTSRAVGMR